MQRPAGRVLAAILFTDMVNSTAVAEELGDRRWKALVGAHHRIVRRELKRQGGTELDTAGDGFFASFREPAPAIACACAIAEAVPDLGIRIRAGIHFGECERMGKKLGGITVVVGARIMAIAGPGEVLVSATAAELARGAGFGVEDRGMHTLKGVEDEWRVMAVTSVDGVPRPALIADDEARARRDRIDPSKTSSRRRVPAVIAAVAVALIIITSITLVRRSSTLVPPEGSLARIKSSGEGFDQIAPLGPQAFPVGMAAGAGRLWVANVGNQTLVEVEPSTGATQVIGTPTSPTGVAFGEDRVWVTYGFSSDQRRRIDALDPANSATAPAPFSVPAGSYPITVGDNAIWVADPLGSSLTRYDPVTNQTSSIALPPGSGPVDLAVAEVPSPIVWVAAGREADVFRIDPSAQGAGFDTFGTGGNVPTALAIGPDGTVWITSSGDDAVIALSPGGTAKLHETIGDQCDAPAEIAATGDGVWVSCSASHAVVRLDPATGEVVATLPVAGPPGPLAVDEQGNVWVGVQSG